MSAKSESGGIDARSVDHQALRFAHVSLVPLIPLIPRFDTSRALLALRANRARGAA